MERNIFYKLTKPKQYLFGILSVIIVSAVCYLITDYIGYRAIAFILLFTVSVIAMFFDIFPVLLVAFLSALIWDFFFIPPKFTFYVTEPEDVLMLLMYFIIALVNAVLTYKKRQWEKIARNREEKRATLKLYNTLLNSLSHELRTPISTILVAADNLKADTKTLPEADRKELITEISKASLRLNRQVENLLNMSRLESGVIKPIRDWCDINELIHEVQNQLKEYAGNHTLKIRIQENLPLFNLDFGLISQSIYNLIYNSLVYTPAGTFVTINATFQSGNLIITVEDEGAGFPETEIEHVFEKFYRLKNSRAGGIGLGLSIVKGFVEAHNGLIKLENKRTGGAKFTIIIPVETSTVNNLKNE
ncbi:MAG TPA: ATP-binding protein [Bacteroidia bacterium]|jgi:two-component system sensor histidine kinase KdpD|nr:ATP-binding protein [Bacteroidia bacterium]